MFYASGGRIPPKRDWSRRAFGPRHSSAASTLGFIKLFLTMGNSTRILYV